MLCQECIAAITIWSCLSFQISFYGWNVVTKWSIASFDRIDTVVFSCLIDEEWTQMPSMSDANCQPKIVQALYNFQPANTDEVRMYW